MKMISSSKEWSGTLLTLQRRMSVGKRPAKNLHYSYHQKGMTRVLTLPGLDLAWS